MPFDQPCPRSFTSGAIREYAPPLSGVYGLSNAVEWVYIGEAEDIQEALLQLLAERRTAVFNRVPTGFVFEICSRARRRERQDRLVFEYEPTCNRHWSRHR
jgi:hypothetical protein